MNKTLISGLTAASVVFMSACAPEAQQQNLNGQTSASNDTTQDQVLDGSEQTNLARVTLSFNFPENAQSSVIQNTTTELVVRLYKSRISRWSEVLGQASLSETQHLEDLIMVDEEPWQFNDVLTGENRNTIGYYFLDVANPTKTLTLIPGPYIIVASQEDSEGQSFSSALMLADLTEGTNNVQIKMLAGTWTFEDGTGVAKPFAMNLFADSLLDMNLDGTVDSLDAVVELQPWLQTDLNDLQQETLTGMHLLNYDSWISEIIGFDEVLVRRTVSGSEVDPIPTGHWGEMEQEPNGDPVSMAGVFQQYYQDAQGEHNDANFVFGSLLYSNYFGGEVVDPQTGDISYVSESSQAFMFTAGLTTADYYSQATGTPTTIDNAPLELDDLSENWGEYMSADYVRSTLTDVDGNLDSDSDGVVDAGIFTPAEAKTGSRIEGTMVQIIQHSKDQAVSTQLDVPVLPEPYLTDPEAAWTFEQANGYMTALQTAISLDGMAVSAGLKAQPSFAAGDNCTTLETISQYFWEGADYYWNTTAGQWEAGRSNPTGIYDSNTGTDLYLDLDGVAGDTTDAIEGVEALVQGYWNRSASELTMADHSYQGMWVIDADSGLYVEAAQIYQYDADEGYYSDADFNSWRAAGPIHAADAGFNCAVNALEALCRFDTPPSDTNLDGVVSIEDGSGLQTAGTPVTVDAYLDVDTGAYIMLEADVDGDGTTELFGEPTDGSSDWSDNGDGTWTNSATLVGATVHVGMTLVENAYYQHTNDTNFFSDPLKPYYYSGKACFDPDQNGCYLDVDSVSLNDVNGNGVYDMIEISPMTMMADTEELTTTMMCWSDFVMTGSSLSSDLLSATTTVDFE